MCCTAGRRVVPVAECWRLMAEERWPSSSARGPVSSSSTSKSSSAPLRKAAWMASSICALSRCDSCSAHRTQHQVPFPSFKQAPRRGSPWCAAPRVTLAYLTHRCDLLEVTLPQLLQEAERGIKCSAWFEVHGGAPGVGGAGGWRPAGREQWPAPGTPSAAAHPLGRSPPPGA